ncbi:MAG: hydantoinase B/oxoprolinase family protein, partial [Pseudomonadota bacterium]|nr:hydantoinase B/oxoprolinase family protein [Pseudomonadota bacterium]
RASTTVADAYLTPVLRDYVSRVSKHMPEIDEAATQLQFMMSSGGLTAASMFQGKDAVLSGPAGGVVGAVHVGRAAGFDRMIGFDMGGTSTDVCHFAGAYERSFDSDVAGIALRAPMMRLHTVAAGGGSILHYDAGRFRVGPESAGAYPGPVAYRNGGPLSVTDANIMTGRITPDHFPALFGPDADQALDADATRAEFEKLADKVATDTGHHQSAEALAEGFLRIANENMAQAIKKISVQRGYDISKYALVCCGGAGGQHACDVADLLEMDTVLIHPMSGLLSAWGIDKAAVRALREDAVETPFNEDCLSMIAERLDGLLASAEAELSAQGLTSAKQKTEVLIRYDGSDTSLPVPLDTIQTMRVAFETAHRQQFGFVYENRDMIVEAITLECVTAESENAASTNSEKQDRHGETKPENDHLFVNGSWREAQRWPRGALETDRPIIGPAIIFEAHATIIVPPDWQLVRSARDDLVLTRHVARKKRIAAGTAHTGAADPVLLEVFNARFMAIAEQMGVTLEKTASSVNIKERLDFSCALFDANGGLIANAPHMPVHLGSMGASVQAVRDVHGPDMREGDAYVVNAPYAGGTHLPDVTLVLPVFMDGEATPRFFTAARGHHADIGGISPGSMPSFSSTIEEEGILFRAFRVRRDGIFDEAELMARLTKGPYSARNPAQNRADILAQLAACETGAQNIRTMYAEFGGDTVNAYVGFVQDNAEENVRQVIDRLHDASFGVDMDCGAVIRVALSVDRAARCLNVDFTGTSAQMDNNFNAPSAVCRAAVLYVFRCMVDSDIPMNEGCLKPINIEIPDGCLLAPEPPAAVVAGNVETSQAICDALFGALGAMAACQGTMNNLTFGNDHLQYYETICGGAGAGDGFHGADAVHTHMTNSRL